jgi:acyl-coenzyme A thioesterase PaaI-like protein
VATEPSMDGRYVWSSAIQVRAFSAESDSNLFCPFKGRDLVHDRNSPVRITQYFVQYGEGEGIEGFERGGVGTVLTGIAVFTKLAESHQGYCHGGSMCSVMDDVVGWCSFLTTGFCRPWSGFTVQVNTSLCKPVPVDSTLLVRALITKVDRRKVYLEATLVDPTDNNNLHAKCEGVAVLNREVLPLLTQSSSISNLTEHSSM